MIKLVYCLRRRQGMTRAEFQVYWRETHAPLVAKHSKTLRIHRYVQARTRDGPLTEALRASRPGPEPFDGVAELWWESADDFAASTATDEAREAARELLEDEKRFIDIAQSPIWIAEEIEVVKPPGRST